MNKKIKKFFVIILLFFIVCCTNNKNTIDIIQSSNNNQVIIRISKKHQKIFRVKLPVKLELKNNSIKNREFLSIRYGYGSIKNKGVIEFIFKKVNNKLIELKNNQKKLIKSYSSKNLIIYSSHKLDSTKSTQQQFKPYIEKMLSQNKDTLHIGTVSEFKKKHKELFEKLTKNDSISIQFLDGKKLGERITVPVKW